MKKVIYLISLIFFSLNIFGQGSLELRWNPSTDNVGVEGYNVFLDGILHGVAPDTFYLFILEAGIYTITVSAFDAAGNESEQSAPLTVTVNDVTPPTIPDLIVVENIDYESIAFKWNESDDNVGVVGYNVYLEGELIDVIKTPYYEMNGLEPESKYLFSFSAIDAAGNESLMSYDVLAYTKPKPLDSLEMLIYPNPTHGLFRLRLSNGTIKNNTVVQIISMDGRMVYQRLLPYGITAPFEEEFNLVERLVEGQYVVILLENNVRIRYTYLIISKPNIYNTIYTYDL